VGGGDGLDRAADAAVTVGLVGAVGSAITGLTDWSDTDGAARKIGLLHGLMNITATSLFVASLVTRRSRQRRAGRLYGFAGYLVSVGAAYLGGELVYGEQVGVNHAFGQTAPSQFTPVLNERDLKEGRPARVQVGDVAVLLVRQGNRVRALADTCAHLGGPLSEGTLGEGTISCPWHGSTYSLEDGSVVCGPTTFPQPSYECRLRGGQVEIRARRKAAEPDAQAQARKVS
jgi:nitrite reductase/ring-hydroxylating ferredoxin subunit